MAFQPWKINGENWESNACSFHFPRVHVLLITMLTLKEQKRSINVINTWKPMTTKPAILKLFGFKNPFTYLKLKAQRAFLFISVISINIYHVRN